MNELSSTPAQQPSSTDSSSSSASLRRELEELRSELKEVQRKSERDVKALNQEVRMREFRIFRSYARY